MSFLKLGAHAHHQADSTRNESYHEIMGQDLANLILADPPYCLLTRRRKKGDLRDPKGHKLEHESVSRFENIKEYRAFTENWMNKACQFLTTVGTLIVWTNFLGKEPIKTIAEKNNLAYWGDYEWVKLTKEGGGNEKLGRLYEVAMVFSKKSKPILSHQDKAECWSVISHYHEDDSHLKWENHPNHKPEKVIEPLLRNFSNEGDIVLDPFSGSGSTPEITIKLNRIIRALEILPKWAEISQQRMKRAVNS